ncbi:histidine phosphatase family protein, partial [Pseudomonas aeruginosa]
GWGQMRTAGEGGGWDRLVSSPLQRCRAFAGELAQRQGIELELENDLRELHFGDWEGRSAASRRDGHSEALGRFWADPYVFTPPGGQHPRLELGQRLA